METQNEVCACGGTSRGHRREGHADTRSLHTPESMELRKEAGHTSMSPPIRHFQRRQSRRDRTHPRGVQGQGEWGVTADGYGVSFWRESALKPRAVMLAHLVNVIKTSEMKTPYG